MVRWINFYRGFAAEVRQAVYTLNANVWPYVAVRTINMSNPTDQGVVVKVWMLPAGEVEPSDQYLVVPGWYLPPKNATTGDSSVSQWTGFEVMARTGDSIWVEASVDNAVSVTINGGGSK